MPSSSSRLRAPNGRACGLDFGTSNSTLGVAGADAPALLALDHGSTTVPSAVFFGLDHAHHVLIGRDAIAAYVDGVQGRFMRSLKSILGTPLIDEKTQLLRRRVAFREIVRTYVETLKHRAEAQSGCPLDRVVHGRPVHFVDGDAAADSRAEATLADIARQAGFSEVSFQYEPVAAAFDYERSVAAETLALVADIGGGTSDFSVVRLGPDRRGRDERKRDILASGGTRLGGTDYDRALALAAVMPALGFRTLMTRGDVEVPSGPYFDLATWATVNRLYDKAVLPELKLVRREAREPKLLARLIHLIEMRRGHSVLIEVERGKIALSDAEETTIPLDWLEKGLHPAATRPQFEAATVPLGERLRNTVRETIAAAGLAAEAIDAVFFTGGGSLVPSVRAAVRAVLPEAAVVDGDRFGAVGLGLTIEAQRRYG
ncbi:Hsp70 family protein [Rhodoplanes sp. TEM]|uniref:Hsp70 family protein n=1 Tax=Rhodoplanes tepidamans TaxID=200616 RepID=A0ABT5JAY4_RHOTP|nr:MULTISPECIES: Hsp70 family protein [Rhodoplanes]MDC7786812.1 Hsp70 family protein [Rhodoplanes tepidamans]MDC7985988.1 Hsp70 family protein [Rhodoplanes sp. TEM]MDQ0355939.1 putative chaperone protein [Rhodoplanes tepidamans]